MWREAKYLIIVIVDAIIRKLKSKMLVIPFVTTIVIFLHDTSTKVSFSPNSVLP